MYYWLDVPQKCVNKVLKYLKNHDYTNYHYYDIDPKKADTLVRIEVYRYKTLIPYEHCLFKYAIDYGTI